MSSAPTSWDAQSASSTRWNVSHTTPVSRSSDATPGAWFSTSKSTVVPDRGAPRTKMGLAGAGFFGRIGEAVRSTRPSARRRRRFGAAQDSTRPLNVGWVEPDVSDTPLIVTDAVRLRPAPVSGSRRGGPSVEAIHHPDAAVGRERGRAAVDPEGLVVALVAREGVRIHGALALRPQLQRLAGPVEPLRLGMAVPAVVAAGIPLHTPELPNEQALLPVHRRLVRRLEDLA